MATLTMPLIVLNMGGEMVYILNQRLQAQFIQEDKASKVLQDVLRAMYSPIFISELFKPQDMYTMSSTKQIFEKLAHSSIMRLNKSSMDKLFDLMLMGFKYQLLSCQSPQQYLQVTLNHLESLKKLIPDAPEVQQLVQVAIDKAVESYSVLSMGQWLLLKQSIFRFFQGKRIKVSLFLQQSLQTPSGVLVLSNSGKLPFGTELPGTIRYFDGKRIISTRHFASAVGTGCIESENIIDATSKLGLNLYTKEEILVPKLYDSTATAESIMKSTKGVGSLSAAAKYSSSNRSTSSSSAKAELNMLADLLGMGISSNTKSPPSSSSKGEPIETSDSKQHFKLNLFPDNAFDSKSGGDKESDGSRGEGGYIQFDIDGAAGAKSMDRYLADFDMKEESIGSAAQSKLAADEDDEDDLLALMDSVK